MNFVYFNSRLKLIKQQTYRLPIVNCTRRITSRMLLVVQSRALLLISKCPITFIKKYVNRWFRND